MVIMDNNGPKTVDIDAFIRTFNNIENKEERIDYFLNASTTIQKIILMNDKNYYDYLTALGKSENPIPLINRYSGKMSGTDYAILAERMEKEDKQKKDFYANSNPELVTKLLRYDPKADVFVENLTIPRRLDLLKACDASVTRAASVLLNSLGDWIIKHPEAINELRDNPDVFNVVQRTQKYKEIETNRLIATQGISRDEAAKQIYTNRIIDYYNQELVATYFAGNRRNYNFRNENNRTINRYWDLSTKQKAKVNQDYNLLIEGKVDKIGSRTSEDVIRISSEKHDIAISHANKAIINIERLTTMSVRDYSILLEDANIYQDILNEKKEYTIPETGETFTQGINLLSFEDQKKIFDSINKDTKYRDRRINAINKTREALIQYAYINHILNDKEGILKTGLYEYLNDDISELTDLPQDLQDNIINYLQENFPDEINLNAKCIKPGYSASSLLNCMEDEVDPKKYLSTAFLADYYVNRGGLGIDGNMSLVTFQNMDKGGLNFKRFGGNLGRAEGLVGISGVQYGKIRKDGKIFDGDKYLGDDPERGVEARDALYGALGGVPTGAAEVCIIQTKDVENFRLPNGGCEGAFLHEWWMGGITSGFNFESFIPQVNIFYDAESLEFSEDHKIANIRLKDGSEFRIIAMGSIKSLDDIFVEAFANYEKNAEELLTILPTKEAQALQEKIEETTPKKTEVMGSSILKEQFEQQKSKVEMKAITDIKGFYNDMNNTPSVTTEDIEVLNPSTAIFDDYKRAEFELKKKKTLSRVITSIKEYILKTKNAILGRDELEEINYGK